MNKTVKKGPKWRQNEDVRVKIVKRNINVIEDKKPINKADIEEISIINNDNIAHIVGWQYVFCLLFASCVITVLYEYVNATSFSLYRISFTEASWYTIQLSLIVFVSLFVIYVGLYLPKYIYKKDISVKGYITNVIGGSKKLAMFSFVLFMICLLLPLSVSFKICLIIIFIIIYFLSIYNRFLICYKDFKGCDQLMVFGAVIVVALLLCYGLLGVIQGNFRRL